MRQSSLVLGLVCGLVVGCAGGADEEPPAGGGGGAGGGVSGSGGLNWDASAGSGGVAGGGGATGGSGGATGGSGGATGGSGGATGGSGGAAGGAGASGGAAGVGGGGGGAAGSGGATGGSGGGGGVGGALPNCDTGGGAPTKTIPDLYKDNPTTATQVFVPNVVVTAISGGKCQLGSNCTLFVQQQDSYSTLAAGKQQAIRVLVKPGGSIFFTTIAVKDRINLLGSVWRHTAGVENELYFEVETPQLPGCGKVVGSGNPQPIPGVTLDDLTVSLLETDGPAFVKIDAVAGKPNKPTESFALFKPGVFNDAGIETVTSLSPFCLTGYQFTGLQEGLLTNFTSITGVFGVFVPSGSSIKYEQLYIRTMADAPIGGN